MSKIILDDDLRAKLNGLNDEVEVCDPSGETVGRFLPEEAYLKLLYAWELHQPVDLDELKRISEETGGRALKEIWKDLGRS